MPSGTEVRDKCEVGREVMHAHCWGVQSSGVGGGIYERLERENRSHLVNSVSGQGEGGAEVHSMTMD